MANIQEIPIQHHMEIITILANDREFCKNWKLFCVALQFKESIMYRLRNMESKNHSIEDIAIDILAHWKSTSTNSSRKLLSEKLREIGCHASADKVESLGAAGSTTKLDQIWYNIRSPTTFYTGRTKEMLEIENQWKNCEASKKMMFVAVTGLGGIGKSEIAKNYAEAFYENIKGHCIWIDSETNQTLTQSFQDLAQEMKISTKDDSDKEKSLNDLAKEIYERISGEKCLIIFDNLESYENYTLSQLIELASKKPPTILKPLILTTSRFRPAIKFFGDRCVHLELEVLSKESACDFFFKTFKLNVDSIPDREIDLIQKLCERLQNYPLVMQQAAAYIKLKLLNKSTNNLEIEIRNYLQAIEAKSKSMLDHKLPYADDGGVQSTTFLTWRITMNKIEEMPKIGKRAARLMEIISFMASGNISTEFLMKILVRLEGDSEANSAKSHNFLHSLLKFVSRSSKGQTIDNPRSNRNCFEVLRDHSMISISEKKVSIHRLVQEVTRIRLIETGKLTDCLHELLNCAQKMLKDNEIAAGDMIDIEMIWGHASKHAELVTKHTELALSICWKFRDVGKYREGFNFSCRAVSTLESILGENHPRTLKLKSWKGDLLEYLGQYAEALEILTQVYEKQRELFGEEDADCLRTANEIGIVHWRLKRYEEVLKWHENGLEIRERIFGKEHQETLNLKNSMALALDGQGKYKEAAEMYEQILEVRERVMGKEHPDTLTTKQNLAVVIFKQGDFEDALNMFKEVLEVRERVSEVDHPLTLINKDWIAATYQSLGRKEEALELRTEVWEKSVKVLGAEHPHTLLVNEKLQRLRSLK